jgi:hypothetical protein
VGAHDAQHLLGRGEAPAHALVEGNEVVEGGGRGFAHPGADLLQAELGPGIEGQAPAEGCGALADLVQDRQARARAVADGHHPAAPGVQAQGQGQSLGHVVVLDHAGDGPARDALGVEVVDPAEDHGNTRKKLSP